VGCSECGDEPLGSGATELVNCSLILEELWYTWSSEKNFHILKDTAYEIINFQTDFSFEMLRCFQGLVLLFKRL
jgi:hypothetical protein